MKTMTFEGLTVPSASDATAAFEGQRILSDCIANSDNTLHFQLHDKKGKPHHIDIPVGAVELLVEILGEWSLGNAVKVVSVQKDMTTQQAADLLNVSRPFFVSLLEKGSLPYHMVGKHRRVKISDMLLFKKEREEKTANAIAALSNLTPDWGFDLSGEDSKHSNETRD